MNAATLINLGVESETLTFLLYVYYIHILFIVLVHFQRSIPTNRLNYNDLTLSKGLKAYRCTDMRTEKEKVG